MRDKVFIQTPTNWLGIFIKLLALAVLVATTNFGFFDRITLLYAAERWVTFFFYLAMWGVSLTALIIAAFQPNQAVRILWALLLSISASAAFMYTSISGSNLTVFDALSLWVAKHEASRAMEFYGTSAILAIVVFIASFVIIASPPTPNGRWLKFGLKWLFWTPAVPVVLMSAVILIKEGGGSQALPSQFQPMAVSLVAVEKIFSINTLPRQSVEMVTDRPRAIKNIVMLIDESVRGDYLNWKKANPYTPFLAANKSKIINFGMAVSGANCSSYSNAILRLGPVRRDLVTTANTNPTIWQYAKRAGYRTVYIDGQSGLVKDPGFLQNFMTVGEVADIDRVVRFAGVANPQLDYKLLEVIEKELQSDQPVFIFANKNGAHFPYDKGYPKNQMKFQPTVRQIGADNVTTRVNSYLNVLAWAVDRFFGQLFDRINLKDTTIIYTSDHGQAVYNGRMTHCSMTNADPREALVPLLAITQDPALKSRFAKGAVLNSGRASHFLIRSTVLDLMGYPKPAIAGKYGPSMFTQGPEKPEFSAGDIFGVFRKEPNWFSIDLSANYLEFPTPPLPVPGPVVKVDK
ncbi:hypothetical protein MNBD_ALPHA08-730 [hydrothermal vent metagenome]|uniref:Sulfatase N-terminal domain-containing protein n=1 Tax=hydrothermal vent metagenome TaxID=652676 RepID=A0A3B0RRS0_9ZZZZ